MARLDGYQKDLKREEREVLSSGPHTGMFKVGGAY